MAGHDASDAPTPCPPGSSEAPEVRAAGARERPDGAKVFDPAASAEIARLRRRLEEYETIFDAAPIMFWYKDLGNRLLRVNRAAAALEGTTPEQMEGHSGWDLYPAEQADAYFADDLDVVRSGRPKLGVVEAHTAVGTGRVAYLDVGKVPVRGPDGEITGIIAFAVDVTQRVQLEDQLRHAQKLETVGRLTGGVAHDFNNLLAGIVGSAELMRARYGHDPVLRDLLDRVLAASGRAADLVRRLLTLSRKGPSSMTPLELHDVIEGTLQLLATVIDRRISVKRNFEATQSKIIGDIGLLQSALLNLALNARDAMGTTGAITFTTRNVDLDPSRGSLSHLAAPMSGPFIELGVVDTGHGMSPEVRARLFEPFFTTKPPGSGTGLGLSAVYHAVQQLGGGIDVDSQPGRGSVFRLYFPVTPASAAKGASRLDPATRSSGCVLFADDEPLLRSAASDVLTERGYEVLLASDGAEAVEVFRREQGRISVVVLDVMMPNLQGPEVFRILRAMQPELPVIMSSAYSFGADRDELMREGLLLFLEKPYSSAELAEAVNQGAARTAATTR